MKKSHPHASCDLCFMATSAKTFALLCRKAARGDALCNHIINQFIAPNGKTEIWFRVNKYRIGTLALKSLYHDDFQDYLKSRTFMVLKSVVSE